MKSFPALTAAVVLTAALFATHAAAADPAYELVIWNQHNGTAKDRGTKSVRVEVFNGGSLLWKADKLEIEWSGDADTKLAVKIPHQNFSFDRVRVTVLEWMAGGGGLAEIELLKDGTNIARQCTVTASAVLQNDERFGPKRLNDGITSSKDFAVGYWLLPNSKAGWAELHLPK